MSFQCGFLNSDFRNEEKAFEELQRMINAGKEFLGNKVGFAVDVQIKRDSTLFQATGHPFYFGYRNTICGDFGYVVSFNGRLDYPECDSDTMVENITENLAVNGVSNASMPNGDYSLTVLDKANNCVYLYRSPFGTRRLVFYYNEASERLAWATSYNQLFQLSDISHCLSHNYLVEYLKNPTNTRMRTSPYKNIFNVIPGECIKLEPSGFKSIFIKEPIIDYSIGSYSADAVHEKFLDLFNVSIKSCLTRTPDTIGIFLSGGLDSSSVAYLASEIIQSEGMPLEIVFRHTGHEMESSEKKFAEIVARETKWPIVTDEVNDDTFMRYLDLETYPKLFEPSSRVLGGTNILLEGPHVSLTGMGGDQILFGSERYVLGLFQRGEYSAAFRSLNEICRIYNMSFLRAVRRHVFLPVLKERNYKYFDGTTLDIFNQSFFRRYMVGSKGYRIPNKYPLEYQERYNDLIQYSQYIPIDGFHLTDGRHPFLNLQLIEFCLSVPTNFKRKHNNQKLILKESMKNKINPAILRRSYGNHTSSMNHLIHSQFKKLSYVVDNSRLVTQGVLDKEKYRRMMGHFQYGTLKQWLEFMKIVELDVWLITNDFEFGE